MSGQNPQGLKTFGSRNPRGTAGWNSPPTEPSKASTPKSRTGRKITVGASSVTLNDGALKELRDQIEEGKGAFIKVGILGDETQRFEPGANNATIGAVHEFGSVNKGIPARSFLRVPLLQYMPDAITTVGPETWRKVILGRGLYAALAQLGVLAVQVVQESFETGGFGLWAPLKAATIRRKKSSAILIDTGQLRRSIHFKVFTRSNAPKAA